MTVIATQNIVMRSAPIFLALIASIAIAQSKTGAPTRIERTRDTSACSIPTSLTLDIPLSPQQNTVWCWNATGEMIMNFLGASPKVVQCEAASKYVGNGIDCCQAHMPDACFTTGWPVFSAYNFSFDQTKDTALSFQELQDQIACKKAPVAFSSHTLVDGVAFGGHMMVARGYLDSADGRFVAINNPWPPPNYEPQNPAGGDQGLITYEKYVTGSDHTHWNDFYDIKK